MEDVGCGLKNPWDTQFVSFSCPSLCSLLFPILLSSLGVWETKIEELALVQRSQACRGIWEASGLPESEGVTRRQGSMCPLPPPTPTLKFLFELPHSICRVHCRMGRWEEGMQPLAEAIGAMPNE